MLRFAPAFHCWTQLRKRCYRAAWLCAYLSLQASCADSSTELVQVSGSTMGTYYRVLAYCDTDPAVESWERLLAQELMALNATFSNYDDSSELMQFNRAAVQAWQPLSANLLAVLRAAQEVHEASDGALDISVAPLVAAWGFGPQAGTELPPSEAKLAEVRQRVGQQYVELNPSLGQARKLRDLQLDLSAVAKGFAVDSLSQTLTSRACTAHLVDIGGEVRATGSKPSGQPWRVGIEVPNDDQLGGIARALPLRNQAVATSGDYRNFITQDQSRWSHTIDPRSGAPVSHRVASVTVVLPTTMMADAWATAFTVMGADAALTFAEAQDWPVLTIERRHAPGQNNQLEQKGAQKVAQSFDERFEVRYTKAMSRLLSPAL